jgi:hypothetical protein
MSEDVCGMLDKISFRLSLFETLLRLFLEATYTEISGLMQDIFKPLVMGWSARANLRKEFGHGLLFSRPTSGPPEGSEVSEEDI